MTRGRHHNHAHLVAATVAEARTQWTDVFSRDRADLGPAHAAEAAADTLDHTPQRTVRDWRRRGIGPRWARFNGCGRLYLTVAEARRFVNAAIVGPQGKDRARA